MGKKIIVVEDEPLLLKALNISLLEKGFDIVAATDGETGLHMIRDFKPDLILLDLILPKMNGFDLLKSLKKLEETKSIPVIILSNLDAKEDFLKGIQLGADDYFLKANTDLSEMVEKIEDILNTRST